MSVEKADKAGEEVTEELAKEVERSQLGRSMRRPGGSKSTRRRERKERGKIQARARRVFTYRGKTLDELKAMTIDELIPLMPARARRSLKRGLTDVQQRFLAHLRRTKGYVRTHLRNMIVLPEFVGRKIGVYDGKEFKEVRIQEEMIGHYLGEFALTRKPVKHTGPGVGATRSSKFMPLK
jgi:small subunit ribosomal protein S19